jgi:hypothetical protein
MRLTEQKSVVTMAKQDLKKYCMRPHVSTMDNICDPFVIICAPHCEKLTASVVELHKSISIQIAAQVAEWVAAQIPGWVAGGFAE